MTRSGTAGRLSEGERTVRPEPLPLRRRWMLRRRGRLDGRHATPDPLFAEPPVVTPMRLLLLDQLTEVVATVREHCVAEINQRRCQLDELVETIEHLAAHVRIAEAELAAAEAKKPDPNAPLRRRLGERDLPDEIVRNRRLREFNQGVERARQHRRQVRQSLEAAQQQRARLRGEIVAIHESAVEQAHRLRATVQRDLAVYNQALLGRHPTAELLRPMLEVREPALPAWTRTQPEA